MRKRIAGICLCLIILLSYRFIPIPTGLTEIGMKTLALLIISIVLLITEAIPLGITAVLILILPAFMNITSLASMLKSFANPILFFTIATFGLSTSLSNTPLAKRILMFFLLKIGGSNVNKFILAIMLSTAIISSIMSNIPATILFMGVCLNFLDLYDTEEEKRRTGRAMMVALPIASMIEFIPNPAGSANYIIALGILNDNTGINVRFVDFIISCAPAAMILLFFAWYLIIKIFKPAPVSNEKIAEFISGINDMGKLQRKEKIAIILIFSMMILWIFSAWIPFLDITIVSMCGLIVMFLPKIDLINWEEFNKEVGWDIIILLGSVLCLANLISSSGVAVWLSEILFRVNENTSSALAIIQLGIFMFIMQIVLPNAPAVISIMTLPVIIIAESIGLNAAILVVPLCLFSSWTMILPLNAVPMLTFSKGYYKMTDISKIGIPVLLALAGIFSLWLPFIMKILHYT